MSTLEGNGQTSFDSLTLEEVISSKEAVVLRCTKCGAIFVEDKWFLGRCPKCGQKIG